MMAQYKANTTIRRVENDRLVYYRVSADRDFWEATWKKTLTEDFYYWTFKYPPDFYKDCLLKYLPQEGKILEAGCGLSQYVLLLRRNGYDCVGVEYAPETVQRVLALHPELPVELGDVTALDVADGTYRAYISLGVIEHRREGPEPFLREAYRVTSADAVLFFSVPYFNPLRRLKHKLGCFRKPSRDYAFYQYAYQTDEMRCILERNRFQVIEVAPLSASKGLRDELPLIKHILQLRGIGWRLNMLIQNSLLLRHSCGHMIMYICKKQTEHA